MSLQLIKPLYLQWLLGAGLLASMTACGGSSDDDYSYRYSVTNALTLADLNGDGKLDVVSADAVHGGGAPHPGYISVRLQTASDSDPFLDPLESDTGADPVGLMAVDLSGNGKLDLVMANYQLMMDPDQSNTLSILLHDASQPGSFLTPSTVSVGTRNPAGVAAGDLKGQGRNDLVVAANGASSVIVFFHGSAAGSFASPVTFAVGGVPTAVAVGDLDGDGLPDIVAATSGDTISVLLQDPANPGTFLPAVDYVTGTHPVSVQIADLDGDGHPDIVTANYGTPTAPTTKGLSVLLQDAAHPGTFQAAVSYDTGDYYATSVAVGDLNADGKLDLVMANAGAPGYPGSVSVFLQDAAHPGTFLVPTVYDGCYGPTGVAIGDLDGDGKPDLAVADGGTFVRFQDPGSPGTFGSPIQLRQ